MVEDAISVKGVAVAIGDGTASSLGSSHAFVLATYSQDREHTWYRTHLDAWSLYE